MSVPAQSSVTRTCPDCGATYTFDEVHRCPTTGRETARQWDLVGATIEGRYEVQGRIGEGGMGIVYRARHVHLGKPVAIKVLRNTQDQEAWQRFVQEARSASMLNHSGIVSTIDFGLLPDNQAYLVMEYLEGRTLTRAISGQPMGTIRALSIALQIARALAAVHEKGIIHRDLKPDNVFLEDKEGRRDLVKIMDFGVAKLESGARLTAHGMVMGTAEYISPEQASGNPIDARCDQYAVGCLMYEMLTGEPVFRAESPGLLMKAHVFDVPVPPRQRRPDAEISETAEAIVIRLLSKDPDQRFASMAALADVVQHEMDQLMAAPMQAGGLGQQLARGFSSSAKLLAGVVVALALIGSGLWWLRNSRPAPSAVTDPAPRPAMATGAPVVSAPKPPVPPPPVHPAAEAGDHHKGKGGTGHVLRVVAVQPHVIKLSCHESEQECRPMCAVVVQPSIGKCLASAPGYATRPYPYKVLAGAAKKGQVQRIMLAPLR